ncbi:hypothetical protein PR048_030533 [Dryococelus australis]|uniref:Uncharacterized protein n=1 Tax=Dryococelus australis TaxID=614101 RepID=A0ABQ9G984_9NEOP|nr:hypothetical protein PR048_030533 [Dryococelus australis]
MATVREYARRTLEHCGLVGPGLNRGGLNDIKLESELRRLTFLQVQCKLSSRPIVVFATMHGCAPARAAKFRTRTGLAESRHEKPRVLDSRPGSTVNLLASYHCQLGSVPGRVTPGFSRVVIVPGDASGQRIFSGISRFPCPWIPALLQSHFNHPHRSSRPRCKEPPESLHSLTHFNGVLKSLDGGRPSCLVASNIIRDETRSICYSTETITNMHMPYHGLKHRKSCDIMYNTIKCFMGVGFRASTSDDRKYEIVMDVSSDVLLVSSLINTAPLATPRNYCTSDHHTYLHLYIGNIPGKSVPVVKGLVVLEEKQFNVGTRRLVVRSQRDSSLPDP